MKNKLGGARSFQKSFLLADTYIEVILKMLILTLTNADIQFAEKKLSWRFYTAVEALPSMKWVEVINKNEFAKAALDEEPKTFMVYVTALGALQRSAEMTIYLL